jgi:hypothetical protein
MPLISVVVPTMRVGGIDVLLDSLARQTFTDFELVLVDSIYNRRNTAVLKKARDRFIAVKHCCPKPSPFPLASYCLMMNVGIAVSEGDVILMAADYSNFPPDLLERHARFHKADTTRKAGLMAPYRYTKINIGPEFPVYGRGDVDRYEADVNSGVLDRWMMSIGNATDLLSDAHEVDGGGMATADCDPKLRMPAGPIGYEFFHAKNESVRRENIMAIDGFDQDLDGTHLYQDSDFSDRLVRSGVVWTLDPTAVLDIANPRHVFPFARRVRDFRDNERIWRSKQAAGYPSRPNSILAGATIRKNDKTPTKPLRVGMVYGEFSSFHQGKFVADDLFIKRGMSGSEFSFFNLARTLAENGNDVAVFCDTAAEATHESGFTMFPIRELARLNDTGVDAFISWNEPDYLRFAPLGAIRIFNQQLNDFAYTHSGWYRECGTWLGSQPPGKTPWGEYVDVYVAPSDETVRWHVSDGGIRSRYPLRAGTPLRAIPNTCDLDYFEQPTQRHFHRAIWASSPDRGLHHLLSMWPDIRRRVPDAELNIFYEVRSLIERLNNVTDENGRRARYVAEALPKLERMGVSVRGFVPSIAIAREYQASAVMSYTCDPTRHTETFAGAVLDACAGGCWPILTDVDCLPSVYGSAATIIPGNPDNNRQRWIDEICARMENGNSQAEKRAMLELANACDRRTVTKKWEALIRECRR